MYNSGLAIVDGMVWLSASQTSIHCRFEGNAVRQMTRKLKACREQTGVVVPDGLLDVCSVDPSLTLADRAFAAGKALQPSYILYV